MTTVPPNVGLAWSPGSIPATGWLGLVTAAAVLAIAGAYLDLPWLHYVGKPLATLLVAAMRAWTAKLSNLYGPGRCTAVL